MNDSTTNDGSTRQVSLENAFIAAKALGASIVLEAKQLLDDYINQRRVLQLQVQREESDGTSADSSPPRPIWWALCMYVRYRKDSLDIGWQEVHYNRKQFKYVYIRRKSGKYDERTLLTSANRYEGDLVRSFEQRARELRADWKRVVAIRTNLRSLAEKNQKPGEGGAA